VFFRSRCPSLVRVRTRNVFLCEVSRVFSVSRDCSFSRVTVLIPGRTRDRAGGRRLSASPGPREESGENSPHLLGNMQRGKSNKKN